MGCIGGIIGFPALILGCVLWLIGALIFILFKPFALCCPCGSCCECVIQAALWLMQLPITILNFFIGCIPC
ncbi:hypothetical protein KC19_11G074800 [Ceratodon purpureus]|uniref:Uncharacterized protein n=1 Tax=Ceratodon purpureus TaxID=3225 RepID=A0A8T0GEH1_CERPU|nr:hypothetical protein KC19_11G074800 [Ceratodon purpureus]